MTYFTTYNLSCPSFLATDLSVCSERYVAVPLNERGNVAVWKIDHPLEKPSILIGHHKIVTALDLSRSPDNHHLCTCSSDNIIIWNLLENGGNPTKGKVIHSHMEQPLFCCFSIDSSKIAFSFSNGMWIYDLKQNSWFISIEESYFTLFNFTNKDNKIVGLKKVYLQTWDLKTNEVITNLTVTPGFPTTLCVHEESGYTIIGTTCGQLNIYGKNYKLVRNIQVWKLLSQYQKSDDPNNEGLIKDYSSDSFPIFSIRALKETADPKVKAESFHLPQVLYLLIVTSTCLFIINANNESIVFFKDFNGDFNTDGVNRRIGLIRFASIACDSDKSVANINVIPVMGESLILIKVFLDEIRMSYFNELKKDLHTKDNLISETNIQKKPLTFLNSVSDRHAKSLLESKVQSTVKNKNVRKASSNLNLPVTFHSNIKSSGYGTLHKPVVLFQPKILKTHKRRSEFQLPLKLNNDFSSKEKNIYKHNEGMSHFERLKILDEIKSDENPMVSSLQISVDGQYASCPSSRGTIDILKLGKKKIQLCHTLNAHKEQVNAAKWSHSEKLLASGSKDKTVKVWNLEKQQPLLTIGLDENSIAETTKRKFVFEESVEQVQFYYLDHFILAAAGNSVYLFEYVINIEKSSIRSFVNKSFAKLMKEIPLSMKRITSLAAMNQFFSNLVLCGGSSKCIEVIDMSVGKVISYMEDVSSRPPYLISLNEGSPFSSHTPAMYDLFLTASQNDGIKIWDLRTNKHVLSYKEHKCRSYSCGAAFSPCGKYIATGSEDKSVYIYDLRQLTYVHKLSDQHIDVFTSVAFTPLSQLLTSSLNGILYFYGQSDIKPT